MIKCNPSSPYIVPGSKTCQPSRNKRYASSLCLEYYTLRIIYFIILLNFFITFFFFYQKKFTRYVLLLFFFFNYYYFRKAVFWARQAGCLFFLDKKEVGESESERERERVREG